MARKKTEERRRAILDTSCKLFGDRGYQKTSIADIASELGMGHGTFYRYFLNKRDIFEQIVKEATGRMASSVLSEAPTAANSLAEYRAQVERICRSLLTLFTSNPALGRLVFFEALGLDTGMRGIVTRAFDLWGTITAPYLENGIAKGFLRPDLDVPVTSLALNAILFEGIRRSLHSDDPKDEAERWITAATSLMFDGLGARPQGLVSESSLPR